VSLAELAPRVRRRLRWQGWAILALSLAAGVVTSLLLWRGLHLRSMGLRYAFAAGVLYVTMLLCLRRWLLWAHADAALHPQDWRRADAQERAAYDGQRARRLADRSNNSIDLGANLLNFDELSWVLLLPALVLFVIGLLGISGAVPMFLGEGMAGLLAELLLQFALGSVMLRRARMPDRLDRLGSELLGRTWLIGLAMVLLAAGSGIALQWADPSLNTLGDLFRR